MSPPASIPVRPGCRRWHPRQLRIALCRRRSSPSSSTPTSFARCPVIVLTASFRTPLTDREGIEPMSTETNQKVTASHLKRSAYLYVRQSTVRQVFENTESTQRQYALRQRAIALGWPSDRVIIIDSDLGQSGLSAGDRAGLQRLLGEVGMGRPS